MSTTRTTGGCTPRLVVKKPTWPFKIDNISAAQAPLLKIYYWDNFKIDSLNEKLATDDEYLEHDLFIPTTQINSCQLKIVFWIRDVSTTGTELHLKRIQNCECITYQTRVGFNQFRKLFHCPHRHLVNINQEVLKTKPNELVALSMTAYFYFLGQHKLTYELTCGENFKLRLNFFVDIVCFDPQKSLITKELVPIEMSEPRRFVQALWVRNITMQDLNFTFNTKTRGLKIINQNLTVPRQSVWPLMVEYRPTDFKNELELIQIFDNVRTCHKITATGYIEHDDSSVTLPTIDIDCSHHRYIVYPNRLDFNVDPDEERSMMVCIHNYNQKCVEFHWQNYIINNLFSITYEPEVFRLKGHHSKLCVVHLRSFDRPLHFKRVPLVLEVHRMLDRSTKIAKALLSDIESIDDPKWKQSSYMEHVLVQLDLKINFRKLPKPDLMCDPIAPISAAWVCEIPVTKAQRLTIFEKLFWEYLSQSNFMRGNKNPEISDELSYREVLDLYTNPQCSKQSSELTKNGVLKLVSFVIATGIRNVSKNWTFVPSDAYERPLR